MYEGESQYTWPLLQQDTLPKSIMSYFQWKQGKRPRRRLLNMLPRDVQYGTTLLRYYLHFLFQMLFVGIRLFSRAWSVLSDGIRKVPKSHCFEGNAEQIRLSAIISWEFHQLHFTCRKCTATYLFWHKIRYRWLWTHFFCLIQVISQIVSTIIVSILSCSNKWCL